MSPLPSEFGQLITSRCQENFDQVLKDGVGMTGDFSCSHEHHDAPNPVLSVEGVGSIGLPLGPRDAEALKATGIATPSEQDSYSWDFNAQQVCCMIDLLQCILMQS